MSVAEPVASGAPAQPRALTPCTCVFCSLLEHCRKHKYLAKSGEAFVRLVVRLMERLLDYRTIMHDENKENRMSCTVNVLVSGTPLPSRASWGPCDVRRRGFPGRCSGPCSFPRLWEGGHEAGPCANVLKIHLRVPPHTRETLKLKIETKDTRD